MFTRLLVNTNKIKKNCQIIKNIAKKYKYKHLIAVLKGNAYGHGVELIAPIVLKNGFDTIAVARVIEAIELRKKVKGKYNIIIIGMADYDEIELVKKYDLIIPITSFEYANNLVKKFKNKLNGLKIQFKLNTGMNRMGFKDAETLNKAFNLLKKYNCKIIGIYSHIYHNSDLIKVKKQFKLFEIIAEGVPNWKKLEYVHIRATESMPYLLDNKLPRISWENALRPGCYVFGPFSYSNEKDDSFNAIQLVSKVVQINNAKIGETVGYESTYAIKKNNELIANIAIGWADGIMRSFSGKNVYINNKKYKIVGKIAMDNMSVLVDKNVKIGDDVLIIKNFKHACEFIDDPSDLGNIIAVIANLSTVRVPRIPIKN